MAEETFRFPPEYYRITSENIRSKKTSNWFCNRPLSPPQTTAQNETSLSPPQVKRMSSSDESFQNEYDSVATGVSQDPDYEPTESENNSDISSSSPQLCFSPDGLFSQSDISSSSPQLWCSPDGLSSPESLLSASHNENKQCDENISRCGKISSASNSKKKVFCYFCESYVFHFPRHLSRNHRSELEVQKILSLPALCSERKHLLSCLRKKGNYLMSSEVTKPVRTGAKDTNYIPCIYCFGFYSSKTLWRHRKRCKENPNKAGMSKSAQADAQNFLIRNVRVDTQLKTDVFPRMRADNVSLVAKKDALICAFAARYLKIHREKHFVLVASRKMRELAKLLIEVRKIKSNTLDLFGALRAENYDTLVSATKTVAEYDAVSQVYKSPTYALNMGTTLKHCCSIALMFTLKKSDLFQTVISANAEAELKTLIQLIENNWKFDVSSQASNDLNLKKWNKVNLVPLASDLKLLKDYLISTADSAVSKLVQNSVNEASYTTLLETIYCRVLLLNRRRPGELQRLLLHTYITTSEQERNQGYEEFSEVLTETEKILMKNLKRIIIRGKRGRGVPVLFSKDVQEHLELILKYRNKNFKLNNIYLFGKPNSSEPIIGYKVMRKYVNLCGAKNPDALTSTRLRKHLATLTQLFDMTENDMEQLASFMGHTLGIHRSSYRLPDEVYQTARISKLLLLMERGEAGQYKGKSLDEINLNLEEDLVEGEREDIEEILPTTGEVSNNSQTNGRKSNNPTAQVSRGKRVLIPWTEEQKNIVITHFHTHIQSKRPPRKQECDNLISKHPHLLGNKDWLKIKVFVQNKYSKK